MLLPAVLLRAWNVGDVPPATGRPNTRPWPQAGGNTRVSHYRIYLLDAGGRIAAAHDVDCVEDDEARANAATLATAGQPAELWHGARLVGRVPGARTAPPAVA